MERDSETVRKGSIWVKRSLSVMMSETVLLAECEVGGQASEKKQMVEVYEVS